MGAGPDHSVTLDLILAFSDELDQSPLSAVYHHSARVEWADWIAD